MRKRPEEIRRRNNKTRRHTGYRWLTGTMCRGTITMEASFLIPWAVLLTALLIILLFYMHNRVWYQTAALETALSGNQYIAGSEGSGRAGAREGAEAENPAGQAAAAQKAEERIRDQAMPGSRPQTEIVCTNGSTEAAFEGQDYPMFSSLFSWSVRESVKKVRPAPVIRGKWVLKKWADAWSGGM